MLCTRFLSLRLLGLALIDRPTRVVAEHFFAIPTSTMPDDDQGMRSEDDERLFLLLDDDQGMRSEDDERLFLLLPPPPPPSHGVDWT